MVQKLRKYFTCWFYGSRKMLKLILFRLRKSTQNIKLVFWNACKFKRLKKRFKIIGSIHIKFFEYLIFFLLQADLLNKAFDAHKTIMAVAARNGKPADVS